jgi:ABC-2 type transport system ATP-binding protein
MLELIADLVRKGIRLVLSSHLLPDVEAVCDRVVVLDSGRVTRAGRLAELLGRGQREFEVRVKGDAHAFAVVLRAKGAQAEPMPLGLTRVMLPESGSRLLFVAAAESGCQVRQVMPARTHLDEVFASAVQAGGSRADS